MTAAARSFWVSAAALKELCTRYLAIVARETGEPFPPDVKSSLEHIILAHHGVYEFGSPKLPMMPEAIAVHYLDNLDAKLHMFLTRIEGDPDPASDWTEFVRGLDVKIFKKDVMGIRP